MTNGAEVSRRSVSMRPRESAAFCGVCHILPIRNRRNIPRSDLTKINLAAWLIAAFLTVFSATSFAQISAKSDSTLAGIKGLFDSGSYIAAELQARRVLEDKKVSDSARVQLEKYLAFALVAQGKNESAVEHFLNALRFDSSLTLDPVLTSPKILSVFETAKQQYHANLARERSMSGIRPIGTVASSHGPSFRAILFPGWEQLHSGRNTKGYVLLAAGASTAASAITSAILRQNARAKYLDAATPSLAESRYSTYNFYYKTEIYSISAFVLVYLYSELDAFLNLPPHFGLEYSPSTGSASIGFHLSF